MKKITYLLVFLCFTMFFSCGQQQEKAYKPTSFVTHPAWSINKTIYHTTITAQQDSYKTFTTQLTELKERGIGIVWLDSVVSEKDYYKSNSQLGSLEDFKQLVDVLHKKGMFVIINWNAKQSNEDNRLRETNPEYFLKQGRNKNDKSTRADLTFNYNNPEMRQYMLAAMKHWVREFDIDGFHCVDAEQLPLDFWDQARGELNNIKPVFMLAEAEAVFLHNRAFDVTYSRQIYNTLHDIIQGIAHATRIDSLLEQERRLLPENAWRLRYVSTADEIAKYKNLIEKQAAEIKPAIVLTATLPGKPLLSADQHIKKDSKDNIFYNMYKLLFNVYQQNPALHWGKMVKISAIDEQDIYAFARIKEQYKVVVILNFSDKRQQVELNSDYLAGAYTELFSNVSVNFESSREFDLEPWAYRVFVKEIDIVNN